eukprot:COSAG04_NODE_84_length_27625_cov_23.289835_11_plen_40_part_00
MRYAQPPAHDPQEFILTQKGDVIAQCGSLLDSVLPMLQA